MLTPWPADTRAKGAGICASHMFEKYQNGGRCVLKITADLQDIKLHPRMQQQQVHRPQGTRMKNKEFTDKVKRL